MPRDLRIRCSCGALQGTAHGVSAAGGNHAVCYCDDCQAFQHFLGRASDVLDAHGGTEIFQMSAGQVSFTAGREHLACMRLSPRGMCRWYAACCHTPLGNTLPTPSIPFVGLVVTCLARPADDPSLQATLGPIRWRAFRKFAQGGTTAAPSGETLASAVLRFLRLGLAWRLRGDGRRAPFFDPQSGKPVAEPRVLTLEERDALRRRL